MKGIYKIVNTNNNKVYIGKCENFQTRMYKHLNLLKKNKHFNNYLQNAFNKYGEHNFKFLLIDECEDLDIKEIHYINLYNSLNKKYGYNLQSGGTGGKHSQETILKQKVSKLHASKKVYGFDTNGILVKEWFSIKECARDINSNSCDVRRTINKKQNICKNFILQHNSVFQNDRLEYLQKRNKKMDCKGRFLKINF